MCACVCVWVGGWVGGCGCGWVGGWVSGWMVWVGVVWGVWVCVYVCSVSVCTCVLSVCVPVYNPLPCPPPLAVAPWTETENRILVKHLQDIHKQLGPHRSVDSVLKQLQYLASQPL